ncbi:hypothetical protein BGZ94_007430 [Podila epigama]|nr:hypothetical protein BGZ94_007430 [Podila epigama]
MALVAVLLSHLPGLIVSAPIHCAQGEEKFFSPVCALDKDGKQKMFDNRCKLELYNIEHPEDVMSFKDYGHCDDSPSYFAGPRVYNPVCAVYADGETRYFENEYRRDQYACFNPQNPSLPNESCTVEF